MKKNFKIYYNYLNYIFVVICFFLFTNISLASEDVIIDINIEGNQRIDPETIISYSKVSQNETYTEELGNTILKDLFDTNLFSNIEISFLDNTLNILVKENPTINLIKFVGNNKIKDEDLIIEISLKERSVYSRSKVKKDIERMLTLYQRAGRLSTEIVPTVEILDNNRINLTYEIEESDITEVSKIVLIGNEIFSSSKIKSLMKTKEKTLLRFFSSADKYDPDKLEYDKQLVTQFYNNNGYPNFKFVSSIAQLTPNRNSFEIILTVDEGETYNFGKLDVTSKLKKMNTEVIKGLLPFKEGDTYNGSMIKESIESIKELAEINGYSFIEIDPKLSENSELKEIDVNIYVDEGPRVYVNQINIDGNVRTIDEVIRREINLSEGDAYNKYNVNYSKDSIRALNFFSKVEVDEERTSFSDKIDLNFTVEEKSTGEASIGAGYSSATDASLQFGLRENNFLGRGQKVNFTSSLSNTRNTYDISITEPYFNNKPLSLTTQLYSSFIDPASVNYETEDLGFGISTKFPTAPDRAMELRYSIFTTKIKADSNATDYELLLAGTDTISVIGHSVIIDKRNSKFKPSRGYNLNFSQDVAGLGGTSYYFKNVIDYNIYRLLGKNLIGSFKFKAGNING